MEAGLSQGECMKVVVAQLCLSLCDPMDCSPSGSSVHGILQARILVWFARVASSGDPLLQGIFPTQGSNSGLLHCKQILNHLSHGEWEVKGECWPLSQISGGWVEGTERLNKPPSPGTSHWTSGVSEQFRQPWQGISTHLSCRRILVLINNSTVKNTIPFIPPKACLSSEW